MTQDKVEDIPVTEEKDGSVTVELPDELVTEDSSDEPIQAQDDGDADQPGDTDAVREARRNRRTSIASQCRQPRRLHRAIFPGIAIWIAQAPNVGPQARQGYIRLSRPRSPPQGAR